MHCSRTSWAAFRVMACLAREAGSGGMPLTARVIARQQRLPQPFVAKMLVRLARAGLVRGARGPGGGYSLTRAPHEISLAEIATVFERSESRLRCPLGTAAGREDVVCPLHASLHRVTTRWIRFLQETTLAVPEKHRPGA
jgi:Rrf2 family protein